MEQEACDEDYQWPIKKRECMGDRFRSLAPEDQFAFIEETFDYPLTEEFWKESGVGDVLADLKPCVPPIRFADRVVKIRQGPPEFHLREIDYWKTPSRPWRCFMMTPKRSRSR